MQVELIMFRTGGERRSFAVVRSTTTIGRREDCDLRIPVGDVSRKHCRLVLSPDNVRIQDLGSSNGTYVNGQRVTDAFLNPGDTVGVGPVHFVVQVDGVPSEHDLTPPAAAGGESALGGTGLAADALVASEAAEAGRGDVVEDASLLQEVPDEPAPADALAPDDLLPEDVSTEDAAYQPATSAADEFTIDEDPAAAADSVQDVAFDGATDSAVAAHRPDAPAATTAGEWDFLVEEPEAGHVDLDAPHGQA